MIYGDLWKIAYFGDFVLFLKEFALKMNLFYAIKNSCRKIILLYYNVCSLNFAHFTLKN